jgi:hypothetical protein
MKAATMKGRFRIAAIALHRAVKIPAWRSLLIYFFVVAFAFQNCLTQSHIHPVQSPVGPGAVVDTGSKVVTGKAVLVAASGKQDKYPANDDPTNCPMCQALALFGHFVAASTTAVHAPTNVGLASITPHLPASILSAASHSWRSRGPPPSKATNS